MSDPRETILILDFGSQYTQLIARRCREEGVFSRIEPFDVEIKTIREYDPIGLILSGGPSSLYDEDAPYRWDDLVELSVPILGICYGMHVMVKGEGGTVEASPNREYGRATLFRMQASRLFAGLTAEQPVWMSHCDRVMDLPSGWQRVGVSDSNIPAAIELPEHNIYGVQFHPEVSHTLSGDKIINNFLYKICSARGGWDMSSFVEQTTQTLKDKIGDQKVICGLSGGVDSAVAATLIHRAVGDQLNCVFIDNGLLRKNEREEVEAVFRSRLIDALTVVEAQGDFYNALSGVTDPEQKRIKIGHTFIELFDKEAAKFSDAKFLAQGTLYPDVIESASSKGPAATIKTHHNVGGLPEKMGLSLIEPLRDLFKDEVRQVGRELGLPDSMVMRHPFPGPGLAVRILGEITPERTAILREADAIFLEELRKADWYNKVSQALAVLLPIRSVGVMGDGRTYEHVIALRSVDTRDFMTADFSPIPHELLAQISSRITNEVHGVNRVVYDITSKPPGTIEWE